MEKIIDKEFKRGEKGFALIALIVAILLLGSIGYIMSSLMIRSQESIPRTLDSTRAFDIAQGGVEYTGKFLKGVTDWTNPGTPCPTASPCTLGTGTFSIQWGTYNAGPPQQITTIIKGISGGAQRQVTAVYQQFGGGNAVTSKGNIVLWGGATVVCNAQTCNQTMIDDGTCPCTQENSTATLPAVTVPGGLSVPGGYSCSGYNGGTFTWPPGTYYCAILHLNSGSIVNLTGPVTIYTNNFEINSGSRLNMNLGSLASNLLVMVTTSGYAQLNSTSWFMGFLYSPGVNVTTNNSSQLTGRVVGLSLTENSGSDVIWDSTAGTLAPGYSGSTGGGGSGGSIGIADWREP